MEMKKYDYKAAKRFIQMHADKIQCASLGMHEDWFWTAETVFEDGKFLIDLDDSSQKIGGIDSSDWATPMLECEMKDGSEVRKECSIGENKGRPPSWFALGCMSGPVQMVRENKYIGNDSNE